MWCLHFSHVSLCLCVCVYGFVCSASRRKMHGILTSIIVFFVVGREAGGEDLCCKRGFFFYSFIVELRTPPPTFFLFHNLKLELGVQPFIRAETYWKDGRIFISIADDDDGEDDAVLHLLFFPTFSKQSEPKKKIYPLLFEKYGGRCTIGSMIKGLGINNLYKRNLAYFSRKSYLKIDGKFRILWIWKSKCNYLLRYN